MKMKGSYRESFGLPLPPAQTEVKINFLAGCDFYIVWPECPDAENILYGWIKRKSEAIKIAAEHRWIILNKKIIKPVE